jgi:hypothetical protein
MPPGKGTKRRVNALLLPDAVPDLLQNTDRRKEVVQQMHDKSGTLEVRGR